MMVMYNGAGGAGGDAQQAGDKAKKDMDTETEELLVQQVRAQERAGPHTGPHKCANCAAAARH
jgi:hypothetical protein